jgi:hypothetical protein
MRPLLLSVVVLLLSACGNVPVEHYRDETPRLDLPHFFTGQVQASGIFQKRSGEVAKRFRVDINGHMQGANLILDERFVYSDGTKQQRTWTLVPTGNGHWQGTAGDVIGVAEGQVSGNTLHWKYTLDLEVDGTRHPVQLDDWMFLMDDNTLVNRSYMSKFGVEVGQISLFFTRATAAPAR